MKNSKLTLISIIAVSVMVICVPTSSAYPTFSQGKVTNPQGESESFGNCKACHGHFRAEEYLALSDGRYWEEIYTSIGESEPHIESGLHDTHRHVMLDRDGLFPRTCRVCHPFGEGPNRFYPVKTNSSATTDFEPLGCVGCHGRAEDHEAQGFPSPGGYGAGLRAHHVTSGIKECMTCHWDANPANYTPVPESVDPPHYFTPDNEFPNKPTNACNPHGEEDYAASSEGLDNDGDGYYDNQDPDCVPVGSDRNNAIAK